MQETAEDLLKAGDLDGALQALQDAVRRNPADAKLRIFLFQLLAVRGDLDRALTQLNVVGELDPSALMMVGAYREALQCERLREEIFDGKRTPVVFGEPSQWVAELIEALRLDAEGHGAQAQALRDKAFEAAPTSAGTIDGQAFAWIADADMRLGPVLEALVNGRYTWVPFHCIAAIDIEEPTDLRDLAWLPAHFTWVNGGDVVGLIPTRYPGSAQGEASECMARATTWSETAGGCAIGRGLRLLATDAGEYGLTQVRRIELASADGADEASHG